MLTVVEKKNHGSSSLLKHKSVSPVGRSGSVGQASEASYKKFLSQEQIDRKQLLRIKADDPARRTMQSPKWTQLEAGKLETTNQNFSKETTLSVFPKVPRKNLKMPDKIKNIFVETRTRSICENRPIAAEFSILDRK